MDIQKILDNAVEAKRAKEMLTSNQLTLGELVLLLSGIKDKSKFVVFDVEGYLPNGLGSWRGSYRELAIHYEGGGEDCYKMDDECKKDRFGDHDYECDCFASTTLPQAPTVNDLLGVLDLAKGRYFQGYKGGDFLMGKTTPLWVANYGVSSGFKTDKAGDMDCQAVVGLEETDDGKVVIKTKLMDY